MPSLTFENTGGALITGDNQPDSELLAASEGLTLAGSVEDFASNLVQNSGGLSLNSSGLIHS